MKHLHRWTVCATAMALSIAAQSQDKARLTFEVASVKPAKSGGRGGGIRPMPGGQTYNATNAPLRLMIKLIYKITDSQIIGGPKWMNDDLWDVEAKAERPSNLDQLHEMFQNLLADRFGLRFHRETREIQAYVLSVDKSGSKMKVSEGQDPYDIPIKGGGPGKIVGTRVPMSYLCWYLSQPFDLPVVDKTSLAGFYDFTIEIPMPPPPPPGARPEDGRGGGIGIQDAQVLVLGAVREQLGLKLDSRKMPVEVFVIDHAEKPGVN